MCTNNNDLEYYYINTLDKIDKKAFRRPNYRSTHSSHNGVKKTKPNVEHFDTLNKITYGRYSMTYVAPHSPLC